MGTNYKAPIWRMPENTNKDKISNYSISNGNVYNHILTTSPYTFIQETGVFTFSAFFKLSNYLGSTNTGPLSGLNVIASTAFSGSEHGFAFYYDNRQAASQTQNLQFNLYTGGNTTSIGVRKGNAGANPPIAGDPVYIDDNDWHHVVVTGDGTNLKMYLDNTLVQVNRTSNTQVAIAGLSSTTSTRNLGFIGVSSAANSFPLKGQLGQFLLYDYKLTTNQITSIYNNGNPFAIAMAPQGYYEFGSDSNPDATAGYPNLSVRADSVFDIPSKSVGTAKKYIATNLNNLSDIDVTDKITVSTWVNFDDVTVNAYNPVVEKGTLSNSSNMSFAISRMRRANAASEGQVYASIKNASGTAVSATSDANAVSSGKWANVVMRYDGAHVKIYVDGKLHDSAAQTGNILDSTPTEPFTIGSNYYYNAGFGNNLVGKISNVQIWNTDLTDGGVSDGSMATGQIAELYNNGQPLMTGAQPQEANLKAWYKLNQSANWEADSTGKWQIPDNRSSFPTSFNFSQNKTIATSHVFSSNIVTGSNKMGVCTISYWYKTPNVTGSHEDYMSLNDGNSSLSAKFRVDSNNKFYYLESNNYLRFAAQTNLDEWNHHCWVFNSATSYDGTVGQTNGDLQFYVNGVAQAVDYNNVATPANSPWTLFNIAKADQSSGSGLDFEMSNLQLYNTNFSAAQVLQLYNNGVPLPTNSVATDNLKAWYKLDNTDSFNNNSNNWNIFNNKYSIATPNYTTALSKSGYGGSHLNFKTSTSLTTNDELTSSFWVKTTQTGTFGVASGTVGAGPFVFSTNRVLIIRGPGNYRYFYNSGSFINDGNWHHILIYSPGYSQTDINNVKLFIDGEVVSLHGTGYTASSPTYDVGSSLGYIGSSGYSNGNGTLAASNVAVWAGDRTSDIAEIYNGGTPALSYTNTPAYWFKLTDISTSAGGGWYDSSGNGNTVSGVTNNPTSISSNVVARQYGASSGMTEQNLVNNNVAVFNGESSGMTAANLVQNNLTKKQPFSNYSINFDYSGGDYMQTTAGSNSILSGATSFTISAWVNFSDLSSGSGLRLIAHNWHAGSTSYNYIFRYYLGQFQLYVHANGSTGNAAHSFTPTLNTWYHVLGTWVGGTIQLYLNGAAVGTPGSRTGTIPTITTSDVIGKYTASGTDYFMDGKISNLAYWKDTALSLDDILNIYNNGVPQDLNNFRITPTAWYPIDDSYTYYNGSVLVARDVISGKDATGQNIIQENLVGTAPGSEGNGTGTNASYANLKGNMYNSDKNAYSINMADYASGVTNPANSGRSTETPSV